MKYSYENKVLEMTRIISNAHQVSGYEGYYDYYSLLQTPQLVTEHNNRDEVAVVAVWWMCM